MEGMKFIETIRLENILSYGASDEPFPLEPLNVLIGSNASGKSNLIEALSLLAATPWDLQTPIRLGGGVEDWLWKGAILPPTATIDVIVKSPYPSAPPFTLIKHRLSFTGNMWRFELVDEVVDSAISIDGTDTPPYLYYRYRFQDGRPVIDMVMATPDQRSQRSLQWDDVSPDQSILSQRRDPNTFPELTYLANLFGRIRIYRDLDIGRLAPVRLPQRPDAYPSELLEDASNLGLVLSHLLNLPPVKARILERMKDFYPSFSDVNVAISGGAAQIFFHEMGLHQPVPATRLSNGSLRYLCLLAVLCHPNPPPVICIEEPELGLHPDIIPEVAKLLVEASSRSQIFVTTHSDILVDCLTDIPESVIVCEKHDGATKLERLDPEQLKPWLEQYRLGDIWTMGQIGGNRW
jgi:predicted ATPase